MRTILTVLLCCFTMSIFAQVLPAVDTDKRAACFIPASALKRFQLKEGKSDDFMKVHNNLAKNAAIQRVNDLRLQAESPEAALAWYKSHSSLLNEDGKEIVNVIAKPAGVDAFNVYGTNEANEQMMKGLDIAQTHYYFTFVIDKYVCKIFIAAQSKKTVKDAWALAKEGIKAQLIAAGRPTGNL